MHKSFYIKYVCIVIACIMISCQKKNAQLYVGTNAEFPPFEYLDKNEIVGFDIDLIQALAKEMNRDICIKNLSWEGLLPALQVKKVDLVISAISATEDRRKVVHFSNSYYTTKEQAIVIMHTNTMITTMDNLQGRRVGVVLGFTGDIILTQDKDQFILSRFNTAFDALNALRKGHIDAVMVDYELARSYQVQMPETKIISGNNTQEQYCIALHKKDHELLQEINGALEKIKNNGIYDSIYAKYFH